MESELANPPSAEYIPEKNGGPVLQPISPKKQIVQQTKNLLNSFLQGIRKFQKIKETSSPKSPRRKRLPFSDYIKQSRVFVLRSSQEQDEERHFETVTDADKPYIHCMMSAAIIATPYAFKQVGIPIGITLIIILAFLIDYCTLLLIQNCILSQQDSYQGFVKEAFGKIMYMIVSGIQILFYLSVMTLYHAVLGDILPKLANRILFLCRVDDFRIGRRFPIIMVAFLILIPLCLCRSIRRLSKLSLVSLFCITALITFSLLRLTAIGHHVPYTHSPFKFSNMNVFQGIGVVTFVYLSHHSSYLFTRSIQDSAMSRFNNTTYANISYSLLCTLMIGMVGFFTFKGLVQGDFLENYCEEDDMANIARVFIAILIIMHYPLECHGGREIIYRVFLPQKTLTLSLHIAITIMMVAVACIISMFVHCVSIILEISGLLLAVPLVLVIPCGSFLRLSKGTVYSLRKLPCLVLASAGSMVIVVGIVMVIFMPHGCIHTTRYLPYCNGSSELLGPLITLMSLNETIQLDPLFNYNVTEFGYENITDIAAAYFT